MGSFLKIIGSAVIVSLFLTACGSSSRELTYRVVGEDTNRASITYTNAEGNTQEEQVDLPWETTFGIDGKFDAELSVTNEDADGNVTCEIQLDGEEKGTQTSAAYAQCVAHFSIDGNSLFTSSSGSTVETYLAKAENYMGDDEPDKALAEIDKAIEIAPDFPDVYFVQGIIYHKTGKLDQAVAAYTQVLELDPEHVNAYYNRAIAYADLGDLEAVEADIKKVKELSDDPEQLAWADNALEKLAPTPTPEPTPTPAQVSIPPITDFSLYEHNMDCSVYNEKFLLQAFSVLYPSGSIITNCQGNPENYVTFEFEPDEAGEDAAFVVALGRFEVDLSDKSDYMSSGMELLTMFSNQIKGQINGEELDLDAGSITRQEDTVLYNDLTGEIEGVPRLIRLALIPNFEQGQGLFFLGLQKIDAAPETAFPAFDEVTQKIITSVEFSSPQPVIGNIIFATEITEDSEPIDPSDSFPPGPTKIYGVFEYDNIVPGMEFSFMWYLNGEEALGNTVTWDDKSSGTTWVNVDHPDGLPVGEYEVQLSVDGEVLQTGGFVIGE